MTIPNIFGISSGTADIVGFAGMACIIFAYGYITGSKHPNPFIQHGVNLLGAGLLAVSLTVNTNMASMVLEGFWAAIAIWGLAKATLARANNA
ncbi:MAG: permease [Novosphingobium sp.]|nr:permease [Novosphingobium sp.]MCP5403065.1 permease [Novosphingobium sp.]